MFRTRGAAIVPNPFSGVTILGALVIAGTVRDTNLDYGLIKIAFPKKSGIFPALEAGGVSPDP